MKKKQIGPIKKYDNDRTYAGFSNYDFVVTPEEARLENVAPLDPNIKYVIDYGNGTFGAGIPTYDNSWQNYWGNKGAAAVSRAQEKAAPYVAAGVYGPLALQLAAPLLSGASVPSVAALKTMAGEVAAAELAGRAWNRIYRGMSGKDWATGLADNIESMTGWRPSEEVTGLFNPGYAMGGAAKKGVELTVDALKNADNLLWKGIQGANGRWVTVGNKQFRLDPNTLGVNGRPVRVREKTPSQNVSVETAPERAVQTEALPNLATRPVRTINPVEGTQAVRVAQPEVQVAPQRVINQPVLELAVNNTNILSDYAQLRSAATHGGQLFDSVLDAVADDSGLPREFIDRYIQDRNININSRYGRQDFLYDYGIRLNGDSVERRDPFYVWKRKANEYKEGIAANDILLNHPERILGIWNGLSNSTNVDTDALRSGLHIYGWDDESVAKLLAKEGATDNSVLNDIGDRFSVLRKIKNLGGNIEPLLTNNIKMLEKHGFSVGDIVNAVANRNSRIAKAYSKLSEFADALDNFSSIYPVANLKKVFGETGPKFTPEEGLSFNQLEMSILFDDLGIGNHMHPNFPRGTSNTKVVRDIKHKFDEAVASPEFSMREEAGGDFSADSYPMVLSMITNLSKERALQGKFPGLMFVNPGTINGNGFANVNLALPGETPYVNGGYELSNVAPLTPEEIAKFPNRTQAVNKINFRLANAYKAFIENSKGIKNMPDYGLDENMINAVIKARGDVNSVDGAASATFGGNGDTPVWATFPDTETRPIYPAISFVFDKGKSIHIKPANKGKFKATMKRTGKSAEELSHSKNPKTRKRAIFALNARKWKH